MDRADPHPRKDEFEEVALPHSDALYNLAFHLTRNGKDAEDLVQETFLRAYRFFDSYQPGTQIKAWLFRILRNTFINRYRAQRARPAEVDFARVEAGYEQAIDSVFLEEHRPVSPERHVMDSVLDDEVRQAVADLPEEYRTVVVLALMEDLSYKEIASALSIPVGTVMSRLHRGRRALQARLVDHARRTGIIRGDSAVSEEKG